MRIIDSYIISGEPVGSSALLERYSLPYSSATIRNEMASLEEDGHLSQPHISAGRVPTERGYRLYVQHLRPVRLTPKNENAFVHMWDEDGDHDDERIKKMSRVIAELSGEIAFVAFHGYHSAVAGLSNLCDKPEFSDRKVVSTLTEIVEKIDDIIESVFPVVGREPEVWIGRHNTFALHCSAVMVKSSYRGSEGIIGIVGPMRMQYGRNKALLALMNEVLQDS